MERDLLKAMCFYLGAIIAADGDADVAQSLAEREIEREKERRCSRE